MAAGHASDLGIFVSRQMGGQEIGCQKDDVVIQEEDDLPPRPAQPLIS